MMKWLKGNKIVAFLLAAVVAITVGTWQGDQPDTTEFYNLGNGTIIQAPPGASLFRPHAIRTATLVVAASDSSTKSKGGADYKCDGTADDVEIQAALDALPASGGTVLMLEGTYDIEDQVTMSPFDSLVGVGEGTIWDLDVANLGTDYAVKTPVSVASGGTWDNWYLGNFRMECGGGNGTLLVDSGMGGRISNMVYNAPWIGIRFEDGGGTYTWHEGQVLEDIQMDAIQGIGIHVDGDNISRAHWSNLFLHIGSSGASTRYGIKIETGAYLHTLLITSLNIWGNGDDRVYFYSDGYTPDLTIISGNFHPYAGYTNYYFHFDDNSSGGIILQNLNYGFGNGFINSGNGTIVETPYYRTIPPAGCYDDFTQLAQTSVDTPAAGYIFGDNIPPRPSPIAWVNSAGEWSTDKVILETTETMTASSLFDEGTWELDFELSGDATTGSLSFDIADAYTGSQNMRVGCSAANDNLTLYYHDGDSGSTIITGVDAAVMDTGNHTVWATRNSSGDIALYFDGVYVDTAAAAGWVDAPYFLAIKNNAMDVDLYIHKVDFYPSTDREWEEIIHIQSGIQLCATGDLAAVAQNSMAFTWQNPYVDHEILVEKIVIDVTTASTPASTLDIALDADGTGTGVDFFEAIDLQGVAISESVESGTGSQTVPIKMAANGGADDWITGKTLDAAGTDLVGKYYIYYTVI